MIVVGTIGTQRDRAEAYNLDTCTFTAVRAPEGGDDAGEGDALPIDQHGEAAEPSVVGKTKVRGGSDHPSGGNPVVRSSIYLGASVLSHQCEGDLAGLDVGRAADKHPMALVVGEDVVG